jgi:hypothetical protein
MANASVWMVGFLLTLGCSGGGSPAPSPSPGPNPSANPYYIGSALLDYSIVIGEAGNVSSSQGGNATFDWFDTNSGFLRLLDRQAVSRPTAEANPGSPIDLIYYSSGSDPSTASFRFATPDFVASTYVDLVGTTLAGVPRRATRIRPALSFRVDAASQSFYGCNRADFESIQNGFDLFAVVVFGDADPSGLVMDSHKEEARLWQFAGRVANDQVFSILVPSQFGLLAGVMLVAHEENAESPMIRVKLMSPP